MDLRPYPYAALFPMMDTAGLASLAADIKAHGQSIPIDVLNGEEIIDGRNRYMACKMAGVAPLTREMNSMFSDESEIAEYIISTNIERRHLTDEQRDQIGARLVTMQAGNPSLQSPQNAGIGVAAAAALVHSTPARIERARTIERADPALAEQVIKGEISKGKAMKEIKARERTKPTDPDRADDKVVDATAEAHADGYTKKMESVWSAYWKLDETEQTAFHERQKEKGMIK